MPSVFDLMVASDAPAMLGEFGEDVLIKLNTEDEADALAIKAVVPRENRIPTGEGPGANEYNELSGVTFSSDPADGVANIKEWFRGGAFHQIKIDGIWWRVKRVDQWNVGGMHSVTLSDGGQQNHS